MMTEAKEHSAYALLKNEYAQVDLDYVILLSQEKNVGEETHKKAVTEAFRILNKRFASYDFSVCIQPEKMRATKSSIQELLAVPPDYCDNKSAKNRHHTPPEPLPYWYAFLEPPHGNPYTRADFRAFHDLLFPNREDTEVVRWNDDFSDYFDAGKEWWGTGLWSAYDRKTDTFVVIGASLTD